ncbi:MAG: alpha/beta hydrolase [Isosphaeraceae bacterium]|nr:alpha/beta hydrolase [Isosphaeraceae bacterium]
MALGMIGLALAQDRVPQPNPRGGVAKEKGKGGLIAPGGAAPPKKARRPAADPLAKNQQAQAVEWPFHFKLKLAAPDGQRLSASFYPSKLRSNAPVLLLLHEIGPGHSGKDFEEPIEDLWGQSLAEHLQEQEYAVLVLTLRGHGNAHNRELTAREWREMTADLQAAYLFLIDRHNRGELNVGKLGVIAIGQAANLAAIWAASGGAVSSEGRISDLQAMALLSPAEEVHGARLGPTIAQIAPRLPLLLIAGKKDADPVKAVQEVVERNRLSKVILFDTPLKATRLLTFYPKAASTVVKYFDDPVKFRTIEWEPRFLLTPVAYSDLELIAKNPPAANANPNPPAEEPKAKSASPAKKGGARKKGTEPKKGEEPKKEAEPKKGGEPGEPKKGGEPGR